MLRIGRTRRRGFRSDRGAELIEFAIAFPILFFVLAGIVDFGFLFHNYEVVTNAAREGARLASLPTYTTADVQSRVNAYLSAAGLTGTATTTVTPQTVTLASGATISGEAVHVVYPYPLAIVGPVGKFFGSGFGSISLKATATMRLEVPAS